jgi:hypothetical protein
MHARATRFPAQGHSAATGMSTSTGLIVAATANDCRVAASVVHDTFTLSDGFLQKTFELVIGSATGTNILVPILAGETNAQVAARIRLAIVTSGLSISARRMSTVHRANASSRSLPRSASARRRGRTRPMLCGNLCAHDGRGAAQE